MGGANPLTGVGTGFVVSWDTERVTVREHGEYFDVCCKEKWDDDWTPVVAQVKTRALANAIVEFLDGKRGNRGDMRETCPHCGSLQKNCWASVDGLGVQIRYCAQTGKPVGIITKDATYKVVEET